MMPSLRKRAQQFLKKLKMELLYDKVILLLGTYSKEMKART
jgi:hypothetical protein